MEVDANVVPVLALADEITPNADATQWEIIRVRKGVEFHNGKTLTIDDVLGTFNRIVKNNYSGASGLAYMDLKNVKRLATYTVSIPTASGYSIMPYTLVGDGEMSIVPVGYDPKSPVGTGALKYKSFSPGVQSTFSRKKKRQLTGAAARPISTPSCINARLRRDGVGERRALERRRLRRPEALHCQRRDLKAGNKTVKIWPGPGWVPFTTVADAAPFNDVNVARRCGSPNRPPTNEARLGGHGLLWHDDLFGVNQADYDSSLPQRVQDIAQAKFLKKAVRGTVTTLVTAPIRTGAVEMATVLKQQASAAGISVNLQSITATAFFGPN